MTDEITEDDVVLSAADTSDEAEAYPDESGLPPLPTFGNDVSDFLKSLSERYDSFAAMLSLASGGNNEVEFKKRYMIKAIDETWIKVIEESLVSLDTIIRNPRKFITENEEVLPIELSRHISSRSIKHLSQHTDYINHIDEDGTITPSKILNVFHEETMDTYENRFINTLINRLYIFIDKRYSNARTLKSDEKTTVLKLSSEFEAEDFKAKLKVDLELTEQPGENEVIGNVSGSAKLWERVEALYQVVNTYNASPFVKAMGKNYIRPPVHHTNAINKNPDFRQCLALWEFIEGYNNVGYEAMVQEIAEKPDDELVKSLLSGLTMQYMQFRKTVDNEADTVASGSLSEVLTPKYKTDLREYASEDFDMLDSVYRKVVPVELRNSRRRLTEDEITIRSAIDAAIKAYDILEEREEQAERQKIEAERKAAEEARLAEEAKIEAERRAAEEARLAEEARIEAERRAAEEARLAEEARIEAERKAAEEARLAEEARIKAEQRAAEEARLAGIVRQESEALKAINELHTMRQRSYDSYGRKKKKQIKKQLSENSKTDEIPKSPDKVLNEEDT